MKNPPSNVTVRLFRSDWHHCSYLSGRSARTLFVDPQLKKNPQLYGLLQESGFRRSGNEIYRPDCAPCHDCMPARLPVERFVPRRRHRRNLKDNQGRFSLSWDTARLSDEYFTLYRHYIASRHPEGDMANPTPDDFERFLVGNWSDTMFMRVHAGNQLAAVAVTDFSSHALSAVYTFFHPRYAHHGLGSFCILNQISETRKLGLPWLYLGFWVPNSPKMDYKISYRPIQLLRDGEWQELGPKDPIPSENVLSLRTREGVKVQNHGKEKG